VVLLAAGNPNVRVAFAYNFDDRSWLGGRNYFSSLFAAIQAVEAEDLELVLVTGHETVTSLPNQFPFLQVVRTSIMDRLSPAWALRQLWRIPSRLKSDPLFARLLRRYGIDVLSHSIGLGRRSGIKSLGWLPDFQFMHLPNYWTSQQLRDTRRSYESACSQCDQLIVSSRAALEDLRAFSPHCGIPAHVLHFVPIPVQIERLRPKEELLKQYDLPEDYFHLPNQFWTHKNHGLVLDALELLKREGTEATVVCTGNATDLRRSQHFETLMARCRGAGVEASFRVLGVVPYVDVQALMAHSRAVINPSRFEGWSTSVEEAKAFGKSVLLSDIPVHREQAPENGEFFSPDSPQTLAALIRQSLNRELPAAVPSELEARNAAALARFGQSYLELIHAL
jgi:glycosyltransferase involved in cell wall biosynthesis